MYVPPIVSRGFTLTEIVVVVSILAFMTALLFQGFAAYSQVQVQQQITTDVARLVQTAKEQSQALTDNDAYGVFVNATSAQLFAQSATSTPLRTVTVPSSFALEAAFANGASMITFTRRAGLPSTAGDIFVFSKQRQATSTVTVLSNGLVE